MSAERRYSDREIATIFEQAAEAQETAQRQLPHGEGLTLAELQQIGHEAGITPEFIVRAAAAVDRTTHSEPRATLLGLPVGVARTVDVPGPLSEADWDRLVVDLRATFQAAGEVRRNGSLREWRNGNLHVLAEPTETGHRLHLRTRKGNAPSRFAGGMVFLAMGLVFMLIGLLTGKPVVDPDTLVLALFAAAGLGGMGITAYQLPRWAEERERQMEAVAGRAVARAVDSSADEPVRAFAPADRFDLDALEDTADEAQDRSPRRTRA